MPFSFNIVIVILTLWSIPWKLYSVWVAAKSNHKKWFVALVLLNTVGILEIFYVFKIAKKSWPAVKEDFRKALGSVK